MKLPPLNALKAFEATARTGSFVAAAGELGVSAAAVSMQVRNLENYLNKKLFVRSNNRIALTDAGQTMYLETAAALNGIATLTARVIGEETRIPLVLSVLPSLGERWLAAKLSGFAQMNTGVGMEIRVENDPVDFALNKIDMRITFGNQLYPEFRSVKLFHDEVTPLCTSEFLPLFEDKNSPGEIPDKHLIHVEWGKEYASNPNWNDWFRAIQTSQQSNISKGIKVAAPSLAIALAVNGLGIALGQKLLASRELASGVIVAPSKHSLKLAQPYCAISTHAGSGNPHINRLIDWLSCTPG